MSELKLKDFEANVPEVELKRLELEEKKIATLWTCCLGNTDSRIITYITKMTLILLLMLFCMFRLATGLGCTESNAYMALLTMLVGIIVPAPTMRSER